jgi:ATPase subunit of ABC transporter with duplicated ATPase domains
LIQFKNLSLTRGVKVLIEGASFQLHPGHKVGLTGANGAGKSSLFALLLGELHAESATSKCRRTGSLLMWRKKPRPYPMQQ